MSLRADFLAEHPGFPLLEADAVASVGRFMRERGWLDAGEEILACGRAGEGNMNLTLRVRTVRRSVILKQSRPWVEKYDMIAAPHDRILFERRFLERTAGVPEVARRMPRLLAFDAEARALLLEDLGDASDFTGVYRGEAVGSGELEELARFAAALHERTRGASDPAFANREMRELNHAHIFVIPLEADNGIELESHERGLQAAAERLKSDAEFVRLVRETGERYLADGPCLLHGDFFPGSWLRTASGIRVIDAEFCFYGDPEWDVAITLSHLAIAGADADAGRGFLASYGGGLRDEMLARYAGCEIMRRLVGVAQLPLPPSTGRRARLLNTSHKLLLSGDPEALWKS